MGTGWRRAFCTSIRRDPETASPVDRQASPSNCTRLGFFGKSGGGSNPSTPRLAQQQQSQPSTPTSLRCRTCRSSTTCPADVPVSPKLQCKTSVADDPATPGSRGRSPKLASPSRFALLRSNLRLITRSSCGICEQSVKARQGTAIFTAECSHVFHFHCIATSVRKQGGSLVCPVCRATWRQVPLLSDASSAHRREEADHQPQKRDHSAAGDDGLPGKEAAGRGSPATGPKVYNDDEPLLSPTASVARRFNPIPEADDEQQQQQQQGEDDDKEEIAGRDEQFRGFFSAVASPLSSPRCTTRRRHQLGSGLAAGTTVQVTVLPDVALLSGGRNHENYVVALKVKAPSPTTPRSASTTAPGTAGSASAAPLLDPSRRAPIDLVTVLDVGGRMTGAKLYMLKRAMRLVVASLGPADRLSIVAFSASAKRLLALRRMSVDGQRAARRIVDRLVCGEGSCAGEALRKAVKVLEDRRERNPVASIMLLSDDIQQQEQGQTYPLDHHRRRRRAAAAPSTSDNIPFSPNTRFAHLEIPVHAPPLIMETPDQEHAEDAFARCVGGLLCVVLQDVRLDISFPSGADVCSVYSCGGRPVALSGGTGPFRLGDMYADEERELLVELRVPAVHHHHHHHHHLSVRCTYRDPSTQELVHSRSQTLHVPLQPRHNAGPAPPKFERLRSLFVRTRAVAEARRLADHGDFATGLHLLSSARRLLLQSSSGPVSALEDLRAVEAELEELHCRRQQMRRSELRETPMPPALEEGGGAEALTPTSAWRAAERLAKVAIMRKSLNRVSDLHGFENARF